MQESEFNQRIDATLEALEMALDEVDADIDYECSGGILSVEFENDSSMIFSRQAGNQQLWVASRSGGYHFAWDEAAQDWRCTRSEQLFKHFVVVEMAAQGGVKLELG